MARLPCPKVCWTRGREAPRSKAWVAWACRNQWGLTLRSIPARKAARKPQKAKTAAKTEGQTKGDTVIERLRAGWTSSKGLQTELVWKPHTLRGYLSRIAMAVKDGGKGLKVERRTGDDGSEYRITN